MRTQSPDELSELIASMTRSEKRRFSIRYHGTRSVLLFDAINKNRAFRDKQLHNLRSSLYKQLLITLRNKPAEKNIEQQLHAEMEDARMLVEKHLYLKANKMLIKIKKMALDLHQVSFRYQALALQKKILTFHLLPLDVFELEKETIEITQEILSINHWSNIYLLVYGWYTRHGQIVNEEERQYVDGFFTDSKNPVGYYAELYALQAKTYHAYICKKDNCALLAEKWIAHLVKIPQIKEMELAQLERARTFLTYSEIKKPEKFKDTPECILEFYHYAKYLFDSRSFNEALDWLIPIVSQKRFYRTDLQIHAREMQITCHEKLGNDEIIDSLKRSLLRFSKTSRIGTLV